jgi:serine/threonine protein kinase
MEAERDPLIDLATAVADGGPVDWGTARSSAGSADDAIAIRELEVIAAIAHLHRDALASGPDASDQDAAILDPAARRWGPLVVLEQLGSGSFGDVFRAWDTSLDREVALKLLRRRAGDSAADSIAREGQLLARIHHANVMAIYGAQAIDGQVGIWGEFLRGRTLAQIVADSGPLSADETLVFADTIARALAAAHRAGLLHRDVKAQNVIREKGGRIVLMDFGLGRDVKSETASEFELAGTPLYLAPELFTGARASAQSDLYSLGVLMFFLATGTFPVTGRSLDDIRAAHDSGKRQRLQDLRPDLTAAFVHIVERALDPDPAKRFESAGAMQAAIVSAGHPTRPLQEPLRGWRAISTPVWVVIALLAAVTAALAYMVATGPTGTPQQPITFAISPPPGWRFTDSSWNVATVSPDGQYVAIVATSEDSGDTQLWLHSLRTMQATPVPESRPASNPFWAPDSTALAFFGDDGLKRISIGAVRSETLAIADEHRGGSWSSTGVLLFAQGPRGGLYRVGGEKRAPGPSVVMTPDAKRGEQGFMWPEFLPDGRRFIFFVLSSSDAVRGIYLGSLDGTKERLIASDTSGTLAGDHLLFVRDGKLAAQRFDSSAGRLAGEAATVIQGVETTFDHRTAVTGSASGLIAYSPAQLTRPLWRDRAGAVREPLNVPPARYRSPAISADGRYLAIQRYRDSLSEIPVFDLRRGDSVTVLKRGATTDTGQTPSVEFPIWSPTGHRLAFVSTESGWQDIYIKQIGSPDPARLAFQSASDKMPTDWSPDGRHLLYQDLRPGGRYRLWALPVDGGGAKPFPLLQGTAVEAEGRFSPDGRRVAFVTTGSGRIDVYVCSFPEATTATKISASGGVDPFWLSNTRLSFLDTAGRLMVADVPLDVSGGIGAPKPLVQTGVVSPGASRNNYAWDLAADRVLVNEPVAQRLPTVMVVLNWQSLLNR